MNGKESAAEPRFFAFFERFWTPPKTVFFPVFAKCPIFANFDDFQKKSKSFSEKIYFLQKYFLFFILASEE